MKYLSRSILGVPQLCSESLFSTISEVLENRELRQQSLNTESIVEAVPSLLSEKLKNLGFGVLEIQGVLTAKPTPFQALCGGTNYTDLIAGMQKLANEGKKKVVLNISSGGGEAYRCFECSRQLRKIADDNNMKLLAFVDGEASSAAYALASSAHEIIADSESYAIGSIGVVIKLLNDSKKLEKEGYSRTYVYAGNNKIPFSQDGSFKQDFLDDLQESVNATYQNFVSHVATYRPLTKQQIIDTQAKVYNADKALSLKLVDKLMTQEQFLNYLQNPTSKQQSTQASLLETIRNKKSAPKVKTQVEAVEEELTYEQEKELHRQKLVSAVRAAKLKRGL